MKKNNFKSLMQAAVLICTPLVIASCDDVFGDVDNPIPSYLTVSEAAVNLELHADHPEKATFIRKANAATGAEVVYSSSNEKIATVDAAGKITAVNGGDCWIRVKATGMDSHGKMTYQEATDSFKVNVKDWRARIALKEDATKAVYNSALVDPATPIDLAEVLDIWPKTGLTIQYGKINSTTHAFEAFTPAQITSDPVIANITAGKITLESVYAFSDVAPEKHNFSTKVVAHIDATALPDGFEAKSFADKQTTAEFTIDVREGIAYITGYDANNKAIEGSMLYLDNDEEGTKPNYTKLNLALAAVTTGDAYLKGGWYYLPSDVASYSRNIRVQGDANFVFADEADLSLSSTKSIMDETTNKSYKLNVYPAKGATYSATSNFRKIQDFSEVNILMPNVSAVMDKIGTANIANGSFGSLTNIGTLNFKNGAVTGKVDKVETANIAAGSFGTLENIGTLDFKSGTVSGMYKIGTANITAGTFNSKNWGTTTTPLWAAFYDVTTLNIKEASINGALNKIGTADISITGTINDDLTDITTLNLKKGSINGALSKIGTATINTAGTITGNYDGTTLNLKKGTISSSTIKVTSLVMDGGTVSSTGGFTGNITMNDGTLTATHTANDKYAIVGDVEVVKGTFLARNDNYVAVNGALTGSFEASTDNGATWTKITGTTSTAPRVKNVVPTAAP